MSRITDLPALVDGLPTDLRAKAGDLFDISLSTGRLVAPPELNGWLIEHFGSVAAVEEQSIVRVTNRWTQEGALFSPLRGSRPQATPSAGEFRKRVTETVGDEFCQPETCTPADTWGRVRGRRTITAANAAKYEGRHGVVIFDQHDPLAFDEELIVDVLDTGRQWADLGHAEEPAASAYLLIWNAGPRAGGSVVHGHAQVTLGHAHYPRVDVVREAANAYAERLAGDYFTDLVDVHRSLGLVAAEAEGVATISTLTPIKERELLIVGRPGMDERDPAFATTVARTAVAYRDVLGVRAFNMALHRPPIDTALASRDGWVSMPPVVHFVDRGDPDSHSSDIGAMELYAAAVVGADPFAIADALREGLPD